MNGNAFIKIGKKVEAVKAMQKIGLLQDFTSEPIIFIYPQALQLKDKKWMRNFCNNVLEVWVMHYPLEDGKEMVDVEFTVYSKETGDFICRFKSGKVYFV